MSEIWKVQRSLFSTEANQQVLIYNEDKSKEGQMDMTPEVEKLFPPDEHKIFVYGTMNAAGEVDIGDFAPWQDW